MRLPIGSVDLAACYPKLSFQVVKRPGLWNFDLSLGKNFSITERVRFQFRADMLNAFNHANLTGVETNITNARFGRLTGATDPRMIQFHLRLAF